MKWFVPLTLLFIAGCASAPEETPTAADLYNEATKLNNQANYIAADDKFSELSSTYPTSRYTQQAILDQLHSYHIRKKYSQAVDAANQFINLYPDHPQVPYAIYMKGIVYFREDRGFLDRFGKQDQSERDQSLLRASYEAFKKLVDDYPDSRFAADATNRMRYLVATMAAHEAHIADYYYRRGAHLAAISRAKQTLASYPDSPATERALEILLAAYQQIGAADGVANTRRLLEKNFPDNPALNADS